LQTYIGEALVPFFEDLPENSSSFYHLLYTGCASLTDDRLTSIGGSLYHENRHLFCEGITADEVRSISPDAIGTPLVIPCLHDPTLYQLSSVPMTIDEVADLARECDLPVSEVEALAGYQYEHMQGSDEGIDSDIAKVFPELSDAIDRWEVSGAERMELTGVGIAIALANIRRKTGQEFDLADWMG
jgi:hypothetical protein